jgi:hypothetical protein
MIDRIDRENVEFCSVRFRTVVFEFEHSIDRSDEQWQLPSLARQVCCRGLLLAF